MVEHAGHKRDGARSGFPFPASARLLKHAAFDRVYQQGRRLFFGDLTVFFRPREAGEAPGGPRVGFTVSRAMGGAVQRNRIKRRLREAVRLNLPRFEAPVDVVINPKRTAATVAFPQLQVEVERAFTQIQQRAAGRASAAMEAETADLRRGKRA